MVANWSSFLGSSRPWFINIDFAGLFIVFAEVCTIISAGSSALMIKLGIQIKKKTLTFQPVIIPTYIPAENWENARYIFMDTYSVTVVPQIFFRVFGKVVDLTRSLMKIRIMVKNL